MTSNRRIFLNIIATYGRSLYSLLCGLFAGRWALMALGEVDYGLFGVVGGLTAFIVFFNNNLSSAVSRFYAFSVGQSQIEGHESEGLDECVRWFNTALTVHLLVPIVLVLVGFPTGEWAIRYFLNIPTSRLDSCLWVWRYVCISCFVSMISVPVNAMYVAKQRIAELSFYSVAATTFNVCFLYYIVSHPGDWLSSYALWTCALAITPQAIIAFRGLISFPECRIKWSYMGDLERVSKVCQFAGWNIFAALGSLLQGQGMAILVNKYFGPRINAASAIAHQVNTQVLSLSSAMVGAYSPAITNACGKGDFNIMRALAYRSCKLAMTLSLMFILPLSLEIKEVLHLWLGNTPPYVEDFSLAMLAIAVIDQASVGHMIAVRAKGQVALYLGILGGLLLMGLPLAWCLILCGLGPRSIIGALFIISVLGTLLRVYLARFLVGLSMRYWVSSIVGPCIIVIAVAGLISALPSFFMPASFLRVVVTSSVCEMVFIPLVWQFILDTEERQYVKQVIRRFFVKVRGIF